MVDQDRQNRKREFLAHPVEHEADVYSPLFRSASTLNVHDEPAQELLADTAAAGPYSHPAYAGSSSTSALPLVAPDPFTEEDDRKTFLMNDDLAESRLDLEEGGGMRKTGEFSTYELSKHMANANEKGISLMEEKEKDTVEIYKETQSRKQWKFLVWCFTWWIPSPLLSSIGRMKRADVRMAWREKVTIFMLITLLCASAIFVVAILGNLICPKEYVYTPSELSQYSYSNNQKNELVAIRGEIFDLSNFANIHYPAVVPTRSVLKYGGVDASSIFPVQVSALCNGKTGSVSPWVTLNTANTTDENAVYHDFRACKLSYRGAIGPD